jgi:hypothetical protein
MSPIVAVVVTGLALFLQTTRPAGDVPPANPGAGADDLARRIVRAAGGDSWPKVTRLRFTFNVDSDGKQVASVTHDWDLRAGTDRVRWKDKDVTVNLAQPGDAEDAKAAFGRWTNDSYWLLMPLKLFDGGVTRSLQPDQEIDGRTYKVLRLGFAGVGLTPGDQYDLFVDPQTDQIRYWDYMPSPDKRSRFTWDGYQSFGPLTLSTEHVTEDGKRRIYFTDVVVTADQ